MDKKRKYLTKQGQRKQILPLQYLQLQPKKNLSVKIGILASDSDDSDKNNKNNTNSQFEESVVVDSSDEVEVIEEPAKDDEAQLGAYLTLLSNK